MPGDTVRLGCKLGAVNGIGKAFSGAICSCDNSTCSFVLANPEWYCVPETVQQMPVWSGGVFNHVKAVYPSYIVLKARDRKIRVDRSFFEIEFSDYNF